MTSIAVTSFGYATETGFGGVDGHVDWSSVGCDGIASLQWRHVSRERNDRFGRMDLLCKCALVAVEMMHRTGWTLAANGRPPAVVMASRYGCIGVDVEYCRTLQSPGGASPLLFASTLPSTALAEIAIRYKLSGPGICLLAGRESAGIALWEAMDLLEGDEAGRCVCVEADAVAPSAVDAVQLLTDTATAPSCRAYAVCLDREDAPGADSESVIARIRRQIPPEDSPLDRGAPVADAPLDTLCEFLGPSPSNKDELRLRGPAALNADEIAIVTRSRRLSHHAPVEGSACDRTR